jgi:type 1 glutamine amidotransferase
MSNARPLVKLVILLVTVALSGGAKLAFAAPGDAADADKPIRALLVAGGCCHDYAKQKDILTQGISARANVVWTISYDPDKGTKHLNPIYEKGDDWAKGFDVIVHDECTADVKDLPIIERVLKPHKEGLPGVVLHCGMHCYRSEGWPQVVTPWFEFTGLQTTGHGAQIPIAVTFIDNRNPVTKTLADWTTIHEELYNNIAGKVLDTATPLAVGKQSRFTFPKKDGKEDRSGAYKETTDESVVVWTNIYNGRTKVFATTLGHNNETVADPRYLDLVTRGLLWSIDKLDDAHLKPAKKVLMDEPGK